MNKNLLNCIRQRWETEVNIVIPEEVWLHVWETSLLPLSPCFGEISAGKYYRFFGGGGLLPLNKNLNYGGLNTPA